MRIAIVVGHNAVAQGAARLPAGVSEYTWNGRLAEAIAALDPDVRVFRRAATPAGYRAELAAVYDAVDAWGAAVAAELHFNAGGGGSGTETWYATAAGAEVAHRVQVAMVAALGLSDRGIRRAGRVPGPGIDGTRGYYSLVSGRAPAILIESHFGDSGADVAAVDRVGVERLAAAILAGLRGGAVAAPESAALAAWRRERAAAERVLAAAQAGLDAVTARRPD